MVTRLEQVAMAFRGLGVVYLVHRPTGEWGPVSVTQYAQLSAAFLADYDVRLDLMSAIELSEAIRRRN